MLWINTSPVDVFAALYAETHYRFPLFKFSRYYRRRPEIVVDLPRRAEGGIIPVTIIVKDAHKFPCRFVKPLDLEFYASGKSESRKLDLTDELIDEPLWYKVREVELPPGKYSAQAKFYYAAGGKTWQAFNHNYPGLPFRPMILNAASQPLPKPAGYAAGDLHTHSVYTSDHVEYGAPLEALSRTAKAMGLDFAAVTDHTYDMDDMPDDFLMNDTELTKWKSFQQEVSCINRNDHNKYAWLIPGQEITARNSKNRNVHFLLLMDNRLFPGGGDSAEKWFRTWSEYSTTDLLDQKSPSALAAAAHPQVKPPFLQKYLLHRGVWEAQDLDHRLSALQIANGEGWREVERGLAFWQVALRQGYKPALWAGNDAHGNFNFFRQVGLPMWNLVQEDHHIFGRWFTGIAAENSLTGIMAGLSQGATYISDGPGIDLRVNGQLPGTTTPGGNLKIEAELVSSAEFGQLSKAQAFIWDNGVLKVKPLSLTPDYYHKISFEEEINRGYVFLQVKTDTGGRAVSSAVFVA